MTQMYVAPKQLKQAEPPPEARQLGAVVWARKHLFNSAFNSVLTVVLTVVFFLAARGMLSWVFAERRLWGVIPANTTNYLVAGYPRPELARVWMTLYAFSALVGLSVAVWHPRSRTSVARLVAAARATGTTVVVLAALAPPTFGWRISVLAGGAVVFLGAVLAGRSLGSGSTEPRIAVLRVVLASLLVGLAVVWLLPIEITTQRSLTAAVVVGLAGFAIGSPIVARFGPRIRPIVVGLWLLALPVNWLHVQRAPVIPWDVVIQDWLPWIAAIEIGGVVLIRVVSRANREAAGLVNALLVLVAIGAWLFDSPFVARALLVVLSVVSIATPTFGTGERGRRSITLAWLGVAAFVVYLHLIGVASTGLDTRNAYFGGFNLTVMLATVGLLLSVPLGLALALGRTSSMPLFRLISTGYIEVVRGVPLITLLFFFRFGILNFVPVGQQIDAIVLILVALTMFSAAYLAENVRGGLQSIPKGQYEASRALGMTTGQMTMLITLPQALRAVIPALVGQVIALFKDTSLVAIIGLADFFRIARDVVPNQPASLGSILENLLFAAAVYWIFTFNFSRASQRLERRLGVGTR